MTAQNKIEIVMTGPLMAYAADQLKARFTVHELWKEQDRAAALAAVKDQVRGVAGGGAHVRIDDALFDALPKLEVVSNFGVGYDNVDAKAAGKRGIIVTNTPDVLTDEVADLAIGLLLATVRQLPQVDRQVAAGRLSADDLAAQAQDRDRRPRPDRQGGGAPARSLRRADRLSRPLAPG